MAIVDAAFYRDEYRGVEVPQDAFRAVEALAEGAVLSAAGVSGEGLDRLSPVALDTVRLAVCAQMDSISLYGDDEVLNPFRGDFTVGRISVSYGGGGTYLAPLAEAYLECAGLLYRGLGVV